MALITIYDDWYPNTRPQLRIMYQNFDVKIEGYKGKYSLTSDFITEAHTICQTFIEGFDKVEQNRATGKQATAWFDNILKGEPVGEPAPAPPVFQTINLPGGAFIGIETRFRELRDFFVSNPVYDKADGDDLMISGGTKAAPDLATVAPDLALSVAVSGEVLISWKKSGFEMLELQYRKAGDEMWQLADKSTEKEFEFMPPMTPGSTEKFEFRAVFVNKNHRVGQWSPIYSIILG